MFLATAYFGGLSVTTIIHAGDIETATINAELAYPDADMLVVESCRGGY